MNSRIDRLEKRIAALDKWLEAERWLIIPETTPRECWSQAIDEASEYADDTHEIIAEWTFDDALRFYQHIGTVRGRMIHLPWSWKAIYDEALEFDVQRPR